MTTRGTRDGQGWVLGERGRCAPIRPMHGCYGRRRRRLRARGPGAGGSAAGRRAAREMQAGPRDLGQRAGGHRHTSYRIVVMRCRRGRGGHRQNPALLLLGVILLALLGDGSCVILSTAVERRRIGRSEDRRRERISRDQLQPRQKRGCSCKGDQKCPQRMKHVGDHEGPTSSSSLRHAVAARQRQTSGRNTPSSMALRGRKEMPQCVAIGSRPAVRPRADLRWTRRLMAVRPTPHGVGLVRSMVQADRL